MKEDWKIGDVICDMYEIVRELGSGGMGKVYLVFHLEWEIYLAMKIPFMESEDNPYIDGFVREAETWMQLQMYPHIVDCYFVRVIEGIPCIFVEYVSGGNLVDWMDKKRLYKGTANEIIARIVDIAIQLAWALDYAHSKSIIHCDMKPSNVMITDHEVVKITDFSIARAAKSFFTKTISGFSEKELIERFHPFTLEYASPEQLKEEFLTDKTDVWSWAITVMEMFTGERCWSYGATILETLNSLLDEWKNPYIRKMPKEIVALLTICFVEKPNQRPNMNYIAQELRSLYPKWRGEAYPKIKPEPLEIVADIINNQAISFIDLDKKKEALELFAEGLAKDPYNLHIIYNRGAMLYQEGNISFGSWLEQLKKAQNRCSELQWQNVIEKLETCEKYWGLYTWKNNSPIQIFCVALKKDIALSYDTENIICIWDVATGLCIRKVSIKNICGEIVSFSIARNSKFFISLDIKGKLQLWDARSGVMLYSMRVTNFIFELMGNAYKVKEIFLQRIREYGAYHIALPDMVTVNNDEAILKYAVYINRKHHPQVWNLLKKKLIYTLNIEVYDCVISFDQMFAVFLCHSQIVAYHLQEHKYLWSETIERYYINKIKLSLDNKMLFSVNVTFYSILW